MDFGEARTAQNGVEDNSHPRLRQAEPAAALHGPGDGERGDVGGKRLGEAQRLNEPLILAGSGGVAVADR